MIPYDEDSASVQFFNMLDNGFILLGETDEGVVAMMGCIFTDYPYNTAYRLCSEMMYWVEPEHRGGTLAVRMIKEAEALAIHEGATAMVMAALETSPEMIETFYNKMGYKRSERAFIKGV
jgi:GNAT superfamily N-acetyltransferase